MSEEKNEAAEKQISPDEELRTRLNTPMTSEEADRAYDEARFRMAQLELMKAQMMAQIADLDQQIKAVQCRYAEIELRANLGALKAAAETKKDA